MPLKIAKGNPPWQGFALLRRIFLPFKANIKTGQKSAKLALFCR
jgi:hypothetical protein